jgi:hypothetical protein
MKSKKSTMFALALVPTTLLVAACSSPDSASTLGSGAIDGTTMIAYVEGIPGGVAIDTTEAKATVSAIDKLTREVTLTDTNGKSFTATVGPEVINFDQIEVGDTVTMTMTQTLAIFMADSADAATEVDSVMAAGAAEGEKPGMILAGGSQTIATVKAIDLAKHAATLEFADGSSETFPVRDDVDLSDRKVGEKVVFQIGTMVTIDVAK